jgi:hypothetical protein
MTEYVMIVVYAPPQHTAALCRAMCDAGAGTVDDGYYDRVTYVSPATCRYRILDTGRREAPPSGQEHESAESRIEAICHRDRIEAVVQAICDAHPYETPAIAVYPTLTAEYRYWKEAAQ